MMEVFLKLMVTIVFLLFFLTALLLIIRRFLKSDDKPSIQKIVNPPHQRILQMVGEMSQISPYTTVGNKELYNKDGVEVYITVTKVDRRAALEAHAQEFMDKENVYRKQIKWLGWAILATVLGSITEWLVMHSPIN
ncbi:hypothetical protein V6R21_18325 [Limibacter armeniacum]|uniref:hypothetical protein n=1 Tax=Limibacter armeniacum TaxID=466084 RepID=UPI002FE6638F